MDFIDRTLEEEISGVSLRAMAATQTHKTDAHPLARPKTSARTEQPEKPATPADSQQRVSPSGVQGFVDGLFGDQMHSKRRVSLAMAVIGVVHAMSLNIHRIGRGIAAAMELDPKHTTKQVDRLLSNDRLDVAALFPAWVEYLIADRNELVVALDWTEFDADNQSVLALYLVTGHGRATPLVWKAVYKSSLKNNRARYETELIELLHGCLPNDKSVTLIADRGFGDVARYDQLDILGWDFIIRFKQGIHIEHKGETRTAKNWMHSSGRARKLLDVRVTGQKRELGATVLVHAKKMKDPWCLATNRRDLSASQIVKLYGRRFSIEETFRDTKDVNFGMGLSATHISRTDRRERLLLFAAMAHSILTLLGAAGEAAGLDRGLKVNTVKRRTLSLYRQGCFWYDAMPNMSGIRLEKLVAAFDKVLAEHRVFREVFGVL